MISELVAGENVFQPMILKTIKTGRSKSPSESLFARGNVEDKSGSLPYITFDANTVEIIRNSDNSKPQAYFVSGKVDISKYSSTGLQVLIEHIEPLKPEDDVSMLMPEGRFDHQAYEAKFQALCKRVHTPTLRKILETVFNPGFCKTFFKTPAGMKMHHAYLGGLLEHTVNVAGLAASMAETIGNVDMDLVISGALLHDVGKVREISTELGFPYMTEGKLLGHITISALMVRDAAADQKIPAASIQELLHIILSHHGEREKGSPMECVTKEAFIVHYADELDAVMNQFDTAEAKGSWSFDYMLKRDLFLKK